MEIGLSMKELVARKEIPLRSGERPSDLVERFLASQDTKQTSKETYRRGLMRFMGWIIREGIQDPTREDILAYKGFLRNQDLSSSTLSSYLVAVRKFFEWTEGVKIYPNVAKGIKGARRSRGFRKDSLTIPQIKELLGGIDRSTLRGKRDYALINLLIRTGVRTIEVTRADVGDIRQVGGEAVLWIQGKGRDEKDEFVVLTEETQRPIMDYLRARGRGGESDPLFASLSDRNRDGRLTTRSISRIVKENLRRIGFDNGRLTAHSLRHTTITLALQGGATIQEAQVLGRHTDINTTLIYAHNINRIAHAPERKVDALLAGMT